MRLIDADELIKNILSQTIMNETDVKIMDRYLYCINNQPTAYDIDKVVEELELHSFEFGTDNLPAHYVRLKDAIKIVKVGGEK